MVMVRLPVVEPKPFEAITLRDRVTALLGVPTIAFVGEP
jgi:hypothetical protein